MYKVGDWYYLVEKVAINRHKIWACEHSILSYFIASFYNVPYLMLQSDLNELKVLTNRSNVVLLYNIYTLNVSVGPHQLRRLS